MNIKRAPLLLLSAWLLCTQSALAATNLNDFLLHGYRVTSRTEVIGTFRGCEKDRSVLLRDKSVFTCNAYSLHRAYAPPAFILQTADVPPRYALIIDGQPYTGSFSKLVGKRLRRPVPVTSEFEVAPPVSIKTSRPLTATKPLMPSNLAQPTFPQSDNE